MSWEFLPRTMNVACFIGHIVLQGIFGEHLSVWAPPSGISEAAMYRNMSGQNSMIFAYPFLQLLDPLVFASKFDS